MYRLFIATLLNIIGYGAITSVAIAATVVTPLNMDLPPQDENQG